MKKNYLFKENVKSVEDEGVVTLFFPLRHKVAKEQVKEEEQERRTKMQVSPNLRTL